MVEGICPRQELLAFTEKGVLKVPHLQDEQLQPASMDLRLGDKVWCLRTSFLPHDSEKIESTIQRLKLFDFNLGKGTNVLERGRTYIIPLQEEISLPEGFHGEFNPKSSTGRADVMTRVLVEGERKFDTVSPGGPKKMYIECTPLSFHVLIREDLALTQLRIGSGNTWLNENELAAKHEETPLLYSYDGRPAKHIAFRHDGIELTVDLESPIVAYRAKINSQSELNLAGGRGVSKKDRDEFWEPIKRPENGELVLEPDCFYLLATREYTRFPHQVCGTLMAYDVTSTEGRVHYAGFCDPGFGFGNTGEIKGTPVTLEVRVYHKPFRIVHGQPICIMRYQKMRDIPKDVSGKTSVYGNGSNYQNQPRGPTFGKQFL